MKKLMLVSMIFVMACTTRETGTSDSTNTVTDTVSTPKDTLEKLPTDTTFIPPTKA